MPNPYRYDILLSADKNGFSQNALLDINININIFWNPHIDIDIEECPYRYRYRYWYFQEWSYRYFQKVLKYRQSIGLIDISNAPNAHWKVRIKSIQSIKFKGTPETMNFSNGSSGTWLHFWCNLNQSESIWNNLNQSTWVQKWMPVMK